MKVRYIGDPNDQFAGELAIKEGGYTFLKDKWEDVPDDHQWAKKFKANPTFEVKGDDRPKLEVTKDEGAEGEQLRAELDKRGVKYRANASNETLQGLLRKEIDTGPDEEQSDASPPVPAK